jgi:predicted HicB family RNase H-like nuclease
MRTAKPLTIGATDLKTLHVLKQKSSRRIALRAEIILACAEGARNKDVAAKFGVSKQMVGRWRALFAADGVAALYGETVRLNRSHLVGGMLEHEHRSVPPTESATNYSGHLMLPLPRSLHARLSKRAAEENVSLSSFLLALIAEGLGRREENPFKGPGRRGSEPIDATKRPPPRHRPSERKRRV